MRKWKIGVAIALASAISSGAAQGAGISVTAKGGYFFATSSVFREVYSGGPVFGGELAVPVSGALHLWAGAEYFSKTGQLTVSEEETKARIIPIYAGLRCHFGKKSLRPYLGAAAAYFLFKEENPLGTVSDNALGFLGQTGLLARLNGALWLDASASYRSAKISDTSGEEPIEANLDGFAIGLGVVLRF
jgi:outer membrane protein W